MSDNEIVEVRAREVIDSRGNPTVEAEVWTSGSVGRAIAPSGASTGVHEALELRDGNDRFLGKGVQQAVENVRGPISRALVGRDATDQASVDRAMIDLDGTDDRSSLGGNAMTAVSLACAHAGAGVKGVELHEHLRPGSRVLPVPMMNIINGGEHAGGELRIQEFMVMPAGAPSFREALRMGVEVYHHLRSILKERFGKSSINLGDEGGFAPPFDTAPQALDVMEEAIRAAGLDPGREVYLCMDAAASEFFSGGSYHLDGRDLSTEELMDYFADLRDRYPLVSLEDPVEEEDLQGMARMTSSLGEGLQLVGDDLFVTNPRRVSKAVEMGAGNALLLKVNQIGTVTEAMEAAKLARDSGYNTVVSHRSGETEDTSIADIAVALECGQIKTGAPARGERISKYNRLLRIEEELGKKAVFPGIRAVKDRPYSPRAQQE